MRRLLVLVFLTLPLSAAAQRAPQATAPAAAPAPAASKGVCATRPALFVQCGRHGSPCCLGDSFYFDPRAHELPRALEILSRIADRDPDETRHQLARLRDSGRLRSADSLRAYPKLAALDATPPR